MGRKWVRRLVVWGLGGCGVLVIITMLGQAVGIFPSTEEMNATRTAQSELTRIAQADIDATLTAMPTNTSTNTPTITPTPTITATPTITPLPSDTLPPSATSTAPPPADTPTLRPGPTVWITNSGARGRSCADTTCNVVDSYNRGDSFTAYSRVDGAAVSGNTTWWHVNDNGRDVYIHASLISTTAVSANPPPAPAGGSSGTGSSGNTSAPPPAVQWNCSGDIYNCGDFSTRSEMLDYFNSCPGDPSGLDGNNDGSPCESTSY